MLTTIKNVLTTMSEVNYYIEALRGDKEDHLRLCRELHTDDHADYFKIETVQLAKKAIVNSTFMSKAINSIRADIVAFLKTKREVLHNNYAVYDNGITKEDVIKYKDMLETLKNGVELTDNQFDVVKSRLLNKGKYLNITFENLKRVVFNKRDVDDIIIYEAKLNVLNKHLDLIFSRTELTSEFKVILEENLEKTKETLAQESNLTRDTESVSDNTHDTLTKEELNEYIVLLVNEDISIIETAVYGRIHELQLEIRAKVNTVLDIAIKVCEGVDKKTEAFIADGELGNLIYSVGDAIEDINVYNHYLTHFKRKLEFHTENVSAFKQYLK